ncbi:hypothetical protein [Emticicia sp. TH156]|uniref:hypothetical protein n=1 Tax=Emticicia sp. TH156 TaxID=2067454 RepID=UPI000C77A156|nr:hypothetical protein [Emticicia sp. TH156]PLK43064.1 hypothetical protein C0V77_16905 [Emticicia sp. TH156]
MKTTLTPFARFLITLAILGGLFFGGKYVLDNTSWGKSLLDKSNETKVDETNTKAPEEGPAAASTPGTSGSNTEATGGGSSTFSYVAREPINGKLKGVVELGASGFNSFIVRIDKSKNWKLEKAEFGNSLVTENMASDDDIRAGLKKYIGSMLDFGVSGRDIHFVVSSGAVKADVTQKIIKNLKTLNYFVNTVTPEQEGALALKCVLPEDYEEEAFVTDIGSGNTKISWSTNGSVSALETYGAKYFQNGVDDGKVYDEVKAKASSVPSMKRKTCFIIGGVPFSMAKKVREGKERYTVLKEPAYYKILTDAKDKSGVNIYKAIKDATGCEQFVFDWDANFTIGFLLGLP